VNYVWVVWLMLLQQEQLSHAPGMGMHIARRGGGGEIILVKAKACVTASTEQKEQQKQASKKFSSILLAIEPTHIV
jgi:hypothetical protein